MNPSDDRLGEILRGARTIAVVGLSDKPDRDSHEVARYLQAQGYRIVPVNPMLSTVLGERAYPSVSAIPRELTIDIVDIFRKSSEVPPIVAESLARKVPVLWMQLGVTNPEAAAGASQSGATVVEDLCIMRVHRRLNIGRVG